ncbi:hypothetical protein [Bacillus cereus]|nr:hypothetical protein [Bacillus cereus]
MSYGSKGISKSDDKGFLIKFIFTVLGAAVIGLASCLLLRDEIDLKLKD